MPYLGDLIGYQPVHEAGEPGDPEHAVSGDTARNKILIPRREVANTIHYRRRKGTLAVLEDTGERRGRLAGPRRRVFQAARLDTEPRITCISIAPARSTCATATRSICSTGRSIDSPTPSMCAASTRTLTPGPLQHSQRRRLRVALEGLFGHAARPPTAWKKSARTATPSACSATIRRCIVRPERETDPTHIAGPN